MSKQYIFAYTTGIAQYDEDGYPVEDAWMHDEEDDETYDEEDIFSDLTETEYE